MKIKTSELTGVALDWAVAQCEGWVDDNDPSKHTDPEEALCVFNWWFTNENKEHKFLVELNYSTNWAQGGPIIEREEIQLRKVGITNWCAKIDLDEGDMMVQENTGHTLLIAAMRCYVASVLGNEVEISEVLL